MGGGAGPMEMLSGFTKSYMPEILYTTGAFTLVTGIVSFLLLLGVAEACYCLLDVEEQSKQNQQALQIVISRLGTLR